METLLVRLKSHDPRRGCVLQRYTYRGIKFHGERGWYRVEMPVADYLRSVRQIAGDEHSQSAFDVCTDAEAKALDDHEKEGTVARFSATDDIKVSDARSDSLVPPHDVPDTATTTDAAPAKTKSSGRKTRRG